MQTNMSKMQHYVPRVSVAAAVLLCLFISIFSVFATTAHAFDHASMTVAGAVQAGHDTEGPMGTSRIMNPFAICDNINIRDASGSTFLIGGTSYVSTFNRFSTDLGFWFGQGTAGVNNGAIQSVRLKGVFGCATLPPSSGPTTTTTTTTVYYVQRDSSLYWVTNDIVFETPIGTADNLFDVSIYNGNLYILTSNNAVYRCTIAAGGVVTGSQCAVVSLTGSADYTNLPVTTSNPKGLVVTAQGIFIAASSAVFWFSPTGAFISMTATNVVFVDVKRARFSDAVTGGVRDLVAASSRAIYSITATGTSITATLITGTEGTGTTTCRPVFDNVDSLTAPAFCGITRIYPLNRDSVYLTISTINTVRSVYVANTTTPKTIGRTPFPANFVDNTSIMPLMLAGMDLELMLQSNIAFPNLAINAPAVTLEDSTWDTTFPVDLSNRFLSDAALAAITETNFARSLHTLSGYYNRTNHFVFGDWNVLPMCSRSAIRRIENAIATSARTVLQYPYIYTSNAYQYTVNGQPNLTLVKLLMPSPFGKIWGGVGSAFVENDTTSLLLASVDFRETLLTAVRREYQPDHIYTQFFLGETYPLSGLTGEQRQEARWVIYDIVMRQLRRCAQDSPASNSGNGEDSDLVEGCVPRVGITNITEIPVTGLPIVNYNITFFVPEGMHYNFIIGSCLDQTVWDDLLEYLQLVAQRKTRSCGTGCIVGIAVACAVVAAILVVAIVILTSKRRRLATVVAPAATSEPKFISTVDVTSDESNPNPLQR